MISLLVLLIIIIVDIFIYKETLTFEFTFDDHLAIENNADVASFDLRYWLHDIWGKDLLEHDSHQSYRPLLITLFQFLWYLSPGSSLLFHFASIYLLLLCSYLVYATFTASNSSIHIVLAASIFFASHPVHIEAVTAVVNMAEPAYSLLSLAAYLAFKIAYSHEYTLINVSYTLVCICCIVLSLLFKETGVVVCVIIAGTIVSRAVVKFLVSISLSKEQQANPFSSIVKLKDIFWIALPSWIVYIYFGFRSLLSHPDRDLLLSNTIETLAHVLFYAFSKAAPSYLNTSQLIRRAENPFAFLTGTEKLLSYLVSSPTISSLTKYHIVKAHLIFCNC
ncbi:hypothetical protein EON65_24680 [archaeon]|nr:MAG: hypothetical protein EON65_24680 [archaeon]